MTEKEAALDRALCNFCNQAGDPFEPASQWDDLVWRAFGNLRVAYDEWYKTKVSTE